MEVTGVSSDVARFYLNAMGGKSERAINYFFSCNGTAHSTVKDGSTSPSFASGPKNIKENSAYSTENMPSSLSATTSVENAENCVTSPAEITSVGRTEQEDSAEDEGEHFGEIDSVNAVDGARSDRSNKTTDAAVAIPARICPEERDFMSATNVTADVARFYLSAMGGKCVRAINYYFSTGGTAHPPELNTVAAEGLMECATSTNTLPSAKPAQCKSSNANLLLIDVDNDDDESVFDADDDDDDDVVSIDSASSEEGVRHSAVCYTLDSDTSSDCTILTATHEQSPITMKKPRVIQLRKGKIVLSGIPVKRPRTSATEEGKDDDDDDEARSSDDGQPSKFDFKNSAVVRAMNDAVVRGEHLTPSLTAIELSLEEATQRVQLVCATTQMHPANKDHLVEGMNFVVQEFKALRARGFPHETEIFDQSSRRQHLLRAQLAPLPFSRASNTKVYESLFSDRNLTKVMWQYFPHYLRVPCGEVKGDIISRFLNDRKLINNIAHIRRSRKTDIERAISAGVLRGRLKINGQSVANFPYGVAAAIYKDWGGAGGTVWDMSGGWGGRMLGAALAGVTRYVATEPSSATFAGLTSLADDIRAVFPQFQIDLHQSGSEDFTGLEDRSCDLCFTSPPYFTQERYADEPTQSYIKFTTKKSWLDGFMKKTLQNCFRLLKPEKYCLVNIEGIPRWPTLATDTAATAQRVGFEVLEPCYLSQTSRPNSARRDDQGRFKETIIVLRKPADAF